MTSVPQVASPLSVSSVAQLTLSLVAIVALIFAVSWLLKRFKVAGPRGRGDLSVIDQVAVRTRASESCCCASARATCWWASGPAGSWASRIEHAHPVAGDSGRARIRRAPARFHEASGVRPVDAASIAAPLARGNIARFAAHGIGRRAGDAAGDRHQDRRGMAGQQYSLTFQVHHPDDLRLTAVAGNAAGDDGVYAASSSFCRCCARQSAMATTPPIRLLTGWRCLLTFFVMSSTLDQAYSNGIKTAHTSTGNSPA